MFENIRLVPRSSGVTYPSGTETRTRKVSITYVPENTHFRKTHTLRDTFKGFLINLKISLATRIWNETWESIAFCWPIRKWPLLGWQRRFLLAEIALNRPCSIKRGEMMRWCFCLCCGHGQSATQEKSCATDIELLSRFLRNNEPFSPQRAQKDCINAVAEQQWTCFCLLFFWKHYISLDCEIFASFRVHEFEVSRKQLSSWNRVGKIRKPPKLLKGAFQLFELQ